MRGLFILVLPLSVFGLGLHSGGRLHTRPLPPPSRRRAVTATHRARARRGDAAPQAAAPVAPLQTFDFHPLLAANRNQNAPGVKLRLHPSGLAYLNQVASNLIARQLPRLLIPNIEHRLSGDQGIISISSVRMSRFRRPILHNITTGPPNRFIWDMRDMNIGLIGDLSGRTNIVVPLELTGEAEVLAEGLDFHLESMLEQSANGSARIRTLGCSTLIDSVQVINHNGGLFGLAVSVFKQGISDNVRNLLEKLICQQVKRYIDDDLNKKLAEVQTRSSLREAMRVNSLGTKSGINAATFFGNDFGSDFFIDYRLREPPSCGVNSIEVACAGEVSYKARGETPFWPPPLGTPRQERQEMMSLLISDYVPNSLFYHAYKQNRLRVLLDRETAGVAGLLRTSCGDSVCLGDLLPQLADVTSANSTLSILFSATRAPAILFSERNGGVMSISLAGLIILYASERSRKKQLAVLDLNALAEATLFIENGKLHSKIRLEKFELTKRFGEVEVSQSELSDIGVIGSSIIENLFNEMFASGIPLPVPHVISLKDVHIRLLSRRLQVGASLIVDESRLSRIAAPLLPFVRPPLNGKGQPPPGLSSLLDLVPPPDTNSAILPAARPLSVRSAAGNARVRRLTPSARFYFRRQ